MNYQRIHDQIIKRAKDRSINELINSSIDGYYETHHIIPKSEGGKNTRNNLVKLTAREHFLIHWLLFRINPLKSRAHAFWMMCNGTKTDTQKRNFTISGRVYEESKIAFQKVNSGKDHPMYGIKGIVHPSYGKIHSKETRQKMSISQKLRPRPLFSKAVLKEIGEKISKKLKGQKRRKRIETSQIFGFDDDVKILTELFKKSKRNAVRKWVMCYGVQSILQQKGNNWAVIESILESVSINDRATIWRQIKEMKELNNEWGNKIQKLNKIKQ